MELIFIRHGQGQHNTDVPDRLNIADPPLTAVGERQVKALRSMLTFIPEDLFIVSPTLRTIQTANLLAERLASPRKYVAPAVGPRMFPMPEMPELHAVLCDKHLPSETIKRRFPDYKLLQTAKDDLWRDGINTMPEEQFREAAVELLDWIVTQETDRAYIVAHDGTITTYRTLLGEKGLTRADFLGEAVYYRMELRS